MTQQVHTIEGLKAELTELENKLVALQTEAESRLSAEARTVSAVAIEESSTLSLSDQEAFQRLGEIRNLLTLAAAGEYHLSRDKLKVPEIIANLVARIQVLIQDPHSAGAHDDPRSTVLRREQQRLTDAPPPMAD